MIKFNNPFKKREIIRRKISNIQQIQKERTKTSKKHYSVAKQIEKTIKEHPKLEHIFIKLPGKNIVDISGVKEINYVSWDSNKLYEYREKYFKESGLTRNKAYKKFAQESSIIHTHHIVKSNSYILPSPSDIVSNIKDKFITSGRLKEAIYCIENRSIPTKKNKVVGRIVCVADLKKTTTEQIKNLNLFKRLLEIQEHKKNSKEQIDFLRKYFMQTYKRYTEYEKKMLNRMKEKNGSFINKLNNISRMYYTENIEKIYADMGIKMRIDYAKEYSYNNKTGQLDYKK